MIILRKFLYINKEFIYNTAQVLIEGSISIFIRCQYSARPK